MRINLHVIVIGAGLTGSFFLKEMIAYLHMKQENLIRTDITVFDPGSISKEDLGAVYIREDLGQNRALLLSELLKVFTRTIIAFKRKCVQQEMKFTKQCTNPWLIFFAKE